MKKILFTIGSMNGGGAEKVLLDMIKNLNKTKYYITVIPIWNEGVYLEELKKYAVVNTLLPSLSQSIVGKITKSFLTRLMCIIPARILYKLIVKEKFDIEIAFVEGMSTKIISGSTNNTSKKIAWVHTDQEVHNYSTKSFNSLANERIAYSRYHRVFCVSNQVKESFESRYKVKAKVQLNILDDELIHRKAEEPSPFIKNHNFFYLVSVGRLVEEKGYDRLLRVAKKLIEEGYKIKVYILGEGILRKELESYIINNSLSEHVLMPGFDTNPYRYMKSSDLFICSSIVEGFSTVVTEALILGIPVVTTNCAGMFDLLGDSEFGLITENNEDGLYNGLKVILNNKELYSHYKQKSAERGKNFSLEKRIKEYEKIFDD